MSSKIKDQYCDWLGLQLLRQYWISQGHTGVPDPVCSCQFKGPDKPETCAYKPKEVN